MFWKIFSTTWFWKISMWPRYYQHILASVIRYVRTKWAAANKCCGVFLTHWFGQVHLGITASKENTVAFFQFKYAELSGYAHFFRFRPQIPFLGKFGPTFKNNFQIPGGSLSFFDALFGRCTAFYGHFLVDVVTSEGVHPHTIISFSAFSKLGKIIIIF